jgi:hypothetical protein
MLPAAARPPIPRLDADAAALFEAQVLPKVTTQTYGPFKKTVLRAVAAADPALAAERAVQALVTGTFAGRRQHPAGAAAR